MNVRRWQYSLLGLLGLTTIASLYLAFASHFPWLATVLLVGGGIWALLLLLADRLVARVRPRSSSWLTVWVGIVVGTLFLIGSVLILAIDLRLYATTAALACGAIMCYVAAWKGILGLGKREQLGDVKPDTGTKSKPRS